VKRSSFSRELSVDRCCFYTQHAHSSIKVITVCIHPYYVTCTLTWLRLRGSLYLELCLIWEASSLCSRLTDDPRTHRHPRRPQSRPVRSFRKITFGPANATCRLGFRYWKHPGTLPVLSIHWICADSGTGPFVQYNGIGGVKGQFLGWWAVMTQAAFSYMCAFVPHLS
jgi:hypothetical protein